MQASILRAAGGALLVWLSPACTNPGAVGPSADSAGGSGAPTNLGGQGGVVGEPSGSSGALNAPAGAGGSPAGGGGAGGAAPCAESAVLCSGLASLPATIKSAGFFPHAPDFSSVAPELLEFKPAWELWSDGLAKRRFLFLPPGSKVDNRDREHWAPPPGAIFVKLFLADGPNGPGTQALETRVIRRTSDDDPLNAYEYAVYRWNDAGSDATLLDPFWAAVDVPVVVGGDAFTHSIPSRTDCDRCHGANATAIIGFDELRLNSSLPGAATTQLASLALKGAFSVAPPADAAQIAVPGDPVLEQVEGFVHGNCAHCHNGNNSTVFDLRYPTFVQSTVGQMTMGSGTAAGLRVDPGNPENSILFRQLRRTMLPEGLNPMPPVGVARASAEALELVSGWIGALPQK